MRTVFLSCVLFLGFMMCPAQVAAQEMANPNTPHLGVSWESIKTLLGTMKTDFQFTSVPDESMVADSPSSRMTVSLFGSAKNTSRATIRYAVGSDGECESNTANMFQISAKFIPGPEILQFVYWFKDNIMSISSEATYSAPGYRVSWILEIGGEDTGCNGGTWGTLSLTSATEDHVPQSYAEAVVTQSTEWLVPLLATAYLEGAGLGIEMGTIKAFWDMPNKNFTYDDGRFTFARSPDRLLHEYVAIREDNVMGAGLVLIYENSLDTSPTFEDFIALAHMLTPRWKMHDLRKWMEVNSSSSEATVSVGRSKIQLRRYHKPNSASNSVSVILMAITPSHERGDTTDPVAIDEEKISKQPRLVSHPASADPPAPEQLGVRNLAKPSDPDLTVVEIRGGKLLQTIYPNVEAKAKGVGGKTRILSNAISSTDSPAVQKTTSPNVVYYGTFRARIARRAKEKWPNDYTMQRYMIKRQTQAYWNVAGLTTVRGVPAAVLNRIKSKVRADWPDDYSMQRYTIKRQTQAYRDVAGHEPCERHD